MQFLPYKYIDVTKNGANFDFTVTSLYDDSVLNSSRSVKSKLVLFFLTSMYLCGSNCIFKPQTSSKDGLSLEEIFRIND